jgi:hypothetical protein
MQNRFIDSLTAIWTVHQVSLVRFFSQVSPQLLRFIVLFPLCWVSSTNVSDQGWLSVSSSCRRVSETVPNRWYSSIRATSRTALFLHWTASVCAARYARSHRLSLELMVAHSKMAYAFTRQLLSSLELRNWLRSSPTNRRKASHVRLLVLLPSILNYSGTQDSLGLYWQIVQAAKQRI